MRSLVEVSLVLLFGSMTIAAQSGSYGVAGMEGLGTDPLRSQTTNIRSSTASGGCPVSLRALHGSSGNMLKVDKNRPAGIAQLLHLILSNPDSRQIVSARVRVRGLSGKGRMTQAANRSDGADATRWLEVRFSAGANNEASGDVWVPGMSAVLEVELNSVTFADGASRRFAGVEACRVAPDPLMLIADR